MVCVYIPHKYKHTSPNSEDVIVQLENLLANCRKLKPNDCIIVMGDFNCELQRNVQGCTGKWLMNRNPDKGHGTRVLSFMRTHDLFAADNMFKPKRRFMFGEETRKRVCNATYLQKDVQLRPKNWITSWSQTAGKAAFTIRRQTGRRHFTGLEKPSTTAS